MASPTIEQIVAQIRTAIFGKDVRENIALGIEKTYADTSTATERINSIVDQIEGIVHVEQISGTTNDYRFIFTEPTEGGQN